MYTGEDDEYWNESASKKFDFGETGENKFGTTDLFGKYASASDNASNIDLKCDTFQKYQFENLEEHLPKDVIKLLLESNYEREDKIVDIPLDEEVRLLRRQVKGLCAKPKPDKVIKAIMLNGSFCLEHFKCFSSKKELLKTAIVCGDGNAILAVTIYLHGSLKKSLFCQLMIECPVAVTHYSNYLFIQRKMQELHDLLDMVGQSKEMSMKQFSLIVQNPKNALQKLRVFKKTHTLEKDEGLLVDEYLKLTEWQIEASKMTDDSIVGISLVDTIKYICKHKDIFMKVEENFHIKGDTGVEDRFAKQFSICEKQYLLASIRGYSENKDWKTVEKLFIAKGWIGREKLTYTSMLDKILLDLQTDGAPNELLDRILSFVNDDEKIVIAEKLKKHTLAIDVFVKRKDRQGLLQYKELLQPKSADYFYADNNLKDTAIRWKN